MLLTRREDERQSVKDFIALLKKLYAEAVAFPA